LAFSKRLNYTEEFLSKLSNKNKFFTIIIAGSKKLNLQLMLMLQEAKIDV